MSDAASTTNQAPAKPEPRPQSKPRRLPPFNVVLLDDDDHTYSYVIDMLRAVFGYGDGQAFQMAQQVDQTGRSIVCTTHRERAELKREQIHAHGADFRIPHCKGSMRAVIEPVSD